MDAPSAEGSSKLDRSLRRQVVIVLFSTSLLVVLAVIWLLVLGHDSSAAQSAARTSRSRTIVLLARLHSHLMLLFGLTGAILVSQALGMYVPLLRRHAAAVAELTRQHARARIAAGRDERAGRLQAGLEMTDDDASVAALAVRAAVQAAPGQHTQLLLADSSRAHLREAAFSETASSERPAVAGPVDPLPDCPSVSASAHGCGVETPVRCPAVQQVRTLAFSSSESLDACPHLARRAVQFGQGAQAPLSAVCAPLSFMGTSFGVLHSYGPAGEAATATEIDELRAVASAAASRIGLLRALADSQLQAAADPLTGLYNRRTLGSRLARLGVADEPYVIAMLDLDHFKILNDTYGHETGDKALRVFAQTLRSAIRDTDQAFRYGGEEFTLVLPATTLDDAGVLCRRLRESLAERLASGDLPGFTVSIGLADHTRGDTPEDVLLAADGSLLAAKAGGRDRAVMSGRHSEHNVFETVS